MSAPGQSVFISYAREDLAAARRIADALSAFEVEVWFDEAGLEGGDAWDQKIRRQIKECSLFTPIISAQTQARREAYFRLEWKLAEERTHLMAEGTAFLLPIAIDETQEAGALVPPSFLRTQWIRLPRGLPNTQFVDRVRALLEAQGRTEVAQSAPIPAAATSAVRSAKKWPWIVLAAVAGAIMAGWAYWPRPGGGPAAIPPASRPAAVAVAPDKSVAVLPFVNMSDDKDNAFFADGVHEDLLTNIANLSALKVISRTSVMQYRGTTKTIHQIAAELGVAYILEGSVRRAGNRVRVTGQLINAANDEHVWAKTYDRDLTDIFATQTELAREIAAALKLVLTPVEAARLTVHQTNNLAAYDLVKQAKALELRGNNVRDLKELIIPLLEQAVAIDPGYVEAWTMLSSTHISIYSLSDRSDARLAQARAALNHADQLAPDDYATLNAGATLGAVSGDRAMVNARRKRIIELFPGRAEAHLASASTAMFEQRWPEARAELQAACRLDPRNPELLEAYCSLLQQRRQFAEAETVQRRLLEILPENLTVRYALAEIALARDGTSEPMRRLALELKTSATTETNVTIVRARCAYALADWPGLVDLWRTTGSRFKFSDAGDRMDRLMIAGAFLELGEENSARALLKENQDELRRQLDSQPTNVAKWMDLGLTLALLGDKAGGREILNKARDLAASAPGGRSANWDIAMYRAWLDEPGEVIEEMARQLRGPQFVPPWSNVHLLRHSWLTKPLRHDPRFKAMLEDPASNAPLP